MSRVELSPLKRHIEESPKLRELRRKRFVQRRRLGILLGILFLTIVGGTTYAAQYPKFLITSVVVSGNQVVDSAEVVAVVEKHLVGNYAYIIPHRNALVYPKESILADLVATFPRFKSVAVTRTNLGTLQVTVSEVHGKALWCGLDTLSPSLDTPCYFTDESGKIVALAPHYSGNVYQRFFGSTLLLPKDDPLGKTFIDEHEFQNLLVFSDMVTHLGLSVEAIIVPGGEEASFVISLPGNKTAKVNFKMTDDYAVLATNLTATLGKSEVVALMKTDKANLEYFDLRFTNKVYYKFSDR